MSDDTGRKVKFKGPGQWRSQADAAQRATRPPAAALDPREAQRARTGKTTQADGDGDEELTGGGHG
jgi:hypothetical protein